ncbi:MAG: divalent metal cation transporter [Planctomycetes bacterium]|nr:divalent metal cation transporter [Planctomycetota bacterium]
MKRLRAFAGSLGPALIVGSIVLGPGSILANSRIGADHGFALVWVLVLAVVLMMGTTTLAGRVGVLVPSTPCQRIADDLGRPAAVVLGLCLFLVVAGFQFSNNIGVLAALDPLVELGPTTRVLALLALNVLCIAALFGFRTLYRPIERMMKTLVLIMSIGFLGNLVIVRPDLSQLAGGLVPRVPEVQDGIDVLPMIALVATTFSLAGAFYQAYLVRQKGFTERDLGAGRRDAITGIAVLGVLSLVIMSTAATTFHGSIAGSELRTVDDVARQLEPGFGEHAKWLFCAGILGGALSSFLGNVLIGGTVLADALGLDANLDGRPTRWATTCALLFGFAVAALTIQVGVAPVEIILTAQASTVLLNPVLALALLYLATRRVNPSARVASTALVILAVVAVLMAFVLAGKTLASFLS